MVPKRAVKQEDARKNEGTIVQVIRNEYVTNVPVRILGETGPERVQITGLLPAVGLIDRVVVGLAVIWHIGSIWRGNGFAGGGGRVSQPCVWWCRRRYRCACRFARARGAIPGSATNQTRPATTAPRAGAAPF